MRRSFGLRLVWLVCLLAGSPSSCLSKSKSINDQGITNSRSAVASTQTDMLDRILAGIPTRNPWARWGMDWARWGKDFARMWQLPYAQNLGSASSGRRGSSHPYDQRYPQSSALNNGGVYPASKLPYSQQSFDGFYPGEAALYEQQPFNGAPYSGSGRERYPFSRRPPSPSYYSNQAAYDPGHQSYYRNQIPRAVPSSYYDNDIRSQQEYPLSDTEEWDDEQKQLVSEPAESQNPSTQSSKSEARPHTAKERRTWE